MTNGTSLLNLDGFARANQWDDLSAGIESHSKVDS
jgi:hypothetical protein